MACITVIPQKPKGEVTTAGKVYRQKVVYMEKQKVKIVSVGECQKCHKIVVRSYPIDTGICRCESVVQVALEPALILPSRDYARLLKYAKMANVSVQKFAEVLLDTAIEELYEKGLQNMCEWLKKNAKT